MTGSVVAARSGRHALAPSRSHRTRNQLGHNRQPGPDRQHRFDRLQGLDLVRALAICLVGYTQLAVWFRDGGRPLWLSELIDTYVVAPLRLNADLRFFGLALFYVISGFVIAKVAVAERGFEFAIRRLLRIFPPLLAAVVLAWVLVNVGWYAIGELTQVGHRDLLASLLLVNSFQEPLVPLVAAAWSLIPLLAVYLMVGLLRPVLVRAPWLAIEIEIVACAVVLAIALNFRGVAAESAGSIGAFGTAIVAGQVIWLVWARRAPLWVGGLLGLGCWVVFAWGDRLGYGRLDDSYPVTLAYAALVVIIAVEATELVPPVRLVSYLATRSYAIFLVHQAIAFTVLASLGEKIWPVFAVAAAVAAVLVVAELLHRVVEQPLARLARVLVGGAR